MLTRFAVLSFFVLSALGLACNATMPPRHRQYILEKAPADLECAREQIKLRALGKNEYEARGCGARAAYRVVCDERHECEARLSKVPVPVKNE
jgi:hypothetical protein